MDREPSAKRTFRPMPARSVCALSPSCAPKPTRGESCILHVSRFSGPGEGASPSVGEPPDGERDHPPVFTSGARACSTPPTPRPYAASGHASARLFFVARFTQARRGQRARAGFGSKVLQPHGMDFERGDGERLVERHRHAGTERPRPNLVTPRIDRIGLSMPVTRHGSAVHLDHELDHVRRHVEAHPGNARTEMRHEEPGALLLGLLPGHGRLGQGVHEDARSFDRLSLPIELECAIDRPWPTGSCIRRCLAARVRIGLPRSRAGANHDRRSDTPGDEASSESIHGKSLSASRARCSGPGCKTIAFQTTDDAWKSPKRERRTTTGCQDAHPASQSCHSGNSLVPPRRRGSCP